MNDGGPGECAAIQHCDDAGEPANDDEDDDGDLHTPLGLGQERGPHASRCKAKWERKQSWQKTAVSSPHLTHCMHCSAALSWLQLRQAYRLLREWGDSYRPIQQPNSSKT